MDREREENFMKYRGMTADELEQEEDEQSRQKSTLYLYDLF